MNNNEPKFYSCSECGIIIEKIRGNKEDFLCDNTPLKRLEPNTSDGAEEKHVPVVEQNDNKVTVKVGSISHPMTQEHNIEWIYLQTEKGCQKVNLKSNEEPVAVFLLSDGDKAVAAYSYCNLHGFWKKEI